ncbi:MAG: hypothetical protein AAF851_07705 [Myxococcota bacterium]
MAPALLGLLAVAAPLELVTVPTSTQADACQVFEAATEVLLRDPTVWVERGQGQLSFSPDDEDGQLRFDGRVAHIRRGSALRDTVRAVAAWRGLEVSPWDVAPSEAAWQAACEGRAEVYELAGTAITPAMLRTPMPRPSKPEGALMRFVDAALASRSGRARPSQLDDWRDALQEGAALVRWVGVERRPEAEASGALGEKGVLFHEGGRYFVVAADTGAREDAEEAQRRTEPQIIDTPRGPLFMDAEGLSWDEHRVELRRPFPELVVGERRLWAANADRLVCFDLGRSTPIWEHVFAEPAVAGPVQTASLLVVPFEDALQAFDANWGRPLWRSELADDLSAPLLAADEVVWALVGARTIIGVDTKTGRWGIRTEALPPLRDRLALGPRLFALAGSKGLWSLELKGRTVEVDPEAAGPIHPRPGLGGFIHRRGDSLVARSAVGTELWKSPSAGRLVSTVDGLGLVLDEEEAQWLDLRQGTVVARFPMASPPRDGVATSAGAVIVNRAGRLLGVPRPGRNRHLEAHAARLLGEAHRQSGARSAALKEADKLLARSPRDLAALLLRARTQRRPELEDWLAVSALAPEGSRARAEALAVMAKLGVASLMPLPSVPRRVVATDTDTVQLDALRWRAGRLEHEGMVPPPTVVRPQNPNPRPVRFGEVESAELYQARVLHGDAAMAVRDGAWWLVVPGEAPSRLVRNPEAQVLKLPSGFAIVDGRKIYGVDAARRRLMGPLFLSTEPLRVEALGDSIVAQSKPGKLERVEPLRVRRKEVWTFGRALTGWATTTSTVVVVTEDAQLVELATD